MNTIKYVDLRTGEQRSIRVRQGGYDIHNPQKGQKPSPAQADETMRKLGFARRRDMPSMRGKK
mgnify:CR=1 FL=1